MRVMTVIFRKYFIVIGFMIATLVIFWMYGSFAPISAGNAPISQLMCEDSLFRRLKLTTDRHFDRFEQPTKRLMQKPGTEVRHIGFLKVHKAASSTMQNLFFRFGSKRNLTFAFTTHPNYFSRSAAGHLPLVPPKYRNDSYDIICNHGIFSKPVYSSLLPADTVYLAIVRDPLDVFISAVNYYSQKSQLLSYLNKIPGNKVANLIRYNRFDQESFSYTKNVMARDFGFEPISEAKVIENKLQEVGSIFRLVLLVEYFDESLVLMRRYLSWTVQDILYLPNNVHEKSGFSKADLTPSDFAKFKVRNFLDYRVYDYFHAKFWRQYTQETGDIYSEVLNFKRILNVLYVFCKGNASLDKLLVKKSNWNEEFSVKKSDCDEMQLNEQLFIDRLRAAQGSELKRPK